MLGDPRRASAPKVMEGWRECDNPTAVRIESYWFEYEWLPRRLSRPGFVLAVCSDPQGKVVEVHQIQVD